MGIGADSMIVSDGAITITRYGTTYTIPKQDDTRVLYRKWTFPSRLFLLFVEGDELIIQLVFIPIRWRRAVARDCQIIGVTGLA
jgi:hypothetical protein